MPKMQFDTRISLGNVLTILGGIFVFIVMFLTSINTNATQDVILDRHEKRIANIEIMSERMARMEEGQSYQQRQLDRIISYMERR